MIKAVIVDDEKGARDVLRGLIEDHFSRIGIVGEAATVAEAAEIINREKPSLLFLDVELSNETAFDLLKKINLEAAELIFTTAHEHYALQAIKFAALDYLLKPVSKDDLAQALRRMEQQTLKLNLREIMDLFRYNLDNRDARLKKILLPINNHMESIPVSDIIRCEGDDNYTHLFLTDKRKITISKTLKYYDELLEHCGFMRVHRSHLINMAHVTGHTKGESIFAIMSDRKEVEISKNKKEEFLRRLEGE